MTIQIAKTYGGKASNLIKISASGIIAPKTWVISNNYPLSVYKRNNIPFGDIDKILDFLDNYPKVNYLELFKIVEDFMEANRGIKRYAIRSSQTYEDGKEQSFSGLFFTELNVGNVANIVNSILKCWRESYNDGVLEYSKKSEEFLPIPCSVIIQEFIPSDSAGVIFKWDNSIIVDSNFGLAKSIVDGETGSDEWTIDSVSKQIVKFYTNKTHCIIPVMTRVNPKVDEKINYNSMANLRVCDFDNNSTTIKVELDEKTRLDKSLTEQQLKQLIQTCELVSNELEIPNFDIEWTYYNDKLYILQCRPLTRKIEITQNNNEHFGIGLVKGEATGRAFKVFDDKSAKDFEAGSILVTKRLAGNTIYAANKAIGCIIESKSPLSHSAIIAREIGIPVIGAVTADRIEDSKVYYINGETGEFKITDQKYVTNKNYSKEDYNNFIDRNCLFDYKLEIER